MTFPVSNPGFAMKRHARGAVLFVALVFLVLLTLLALTATGTSILQEKMTGGMRNRQLGLMGAESALRGGESFFSTAIFNGGNPLPPCIEGAGSVCAYRPNQGRLFDEVQTFRTEKTSVGALGGSPVYTEPLTGLTGDAETASLHSQPVYVIEDLGKNVSPGYGQQRGNIDFENRASAWFYRVTARSQGGSGAVLRIAESVYSPGLNLANAGANPAETP
jgi:type IV pilus assembly protein PilX